MDPFKGRGVFKIHNFLTAQDATGAGNVLDVSDYRYVTVTVASDNSANLTVKCVGSTGGQLRNGIIVLDEPTWTSVQSVSNQYDFIGMYDYQSATFLAGDTGVVFGGTDDVIVYTVNVDGLRYLNFRVTARSAGDVTITGMAFDNQ